jgi:hypothetical protein
MMINIPVEGVGIKSLIAEAVTMTAGVTAGALDKLFYVAESHGRLEGNSRSAEAESVCFYMIIPGNRGKKNPPRVRVLPSAISGRVSRG